MTHFHERLATALAHAYDVIEIRVPNKKNFQFGAFVKLLSASVNSEALQRFTEALQSFAPACKWAWHSKMASDNRCVLFITGRIAAKRQPAGIVFTQ